MRAMPWFLILVRLLPSAGKSSTASKVPFTIASLSTAIEYSAGMMLVSWQTPTTKVAFLTLMRSNALASLACEGAIACVWLNQGLVPKLLGPHHDEMAMLLALGVSPAAATVVGYAAGSCDLILGVAMLALRRQAWPLWLTIGLMVFLLAHASWAAPRLLLGASNPVRLNVAVAALALVALMLRQDETRAEI
jgi:hypothetical protein